MELEDIHGAHDLLLFSCFEHLRTEVILKLVYLLLLTFDLVFVLRFLAGDLDDAFVELFVLLGEALPLLLELQLHTCQLVLQVLVLVLKFLINAPQPRVLVHCLLSIHLQFIALFSGLRAIVLVGDALSDQGVDRRDSLLNVGDARTEQVTDGGHSIALLGLTDVVHVIHELGNLDLLLLVLLVGSS